MTARYMWCCGTRQNCIACSVEPAKKLCAEGPMIVDLHHHPMMTCVHQTFVWQCFLDRLWQCLAVSCMCWVLQFPKLMFWRRNARLSMLLQQLQCRWAVRQMAVYHYWLVFVMTMLSKRCWRPPVDYWSSMIDASLRWKQNDLILICCCLTAAAYCRAIVITVIHGIWYCQLPSWKGSDCFQQIFTTMSNSTAKIAVASPFAFIWYRLADTRFTTPFSLTLMLQAAWQPCLCARISTRELTIVPLSIQDRRMPLQHARYQFKLWQQHHIIFKIRAAQGCSTRLYDAFPSLSCCICLEWVIQDIQHTLNACAVKVALQASKHSCLATVGLMKITKLQTWAAIQEQLYHRSISTRPAFWGLHAGTTVMCNPEADHIDLQVSACLASQCIIWHLHKRFSVSMHTVKKHNIS